MRGEGLDQPLHYLRRRFGFGESDGARRRARSQGHRLNSQVAQQFPLARRKERILVGFVTGSGKRTKPLILPARPGRSGAAVEGIAPTCFTVMGVETGYICGPGAPRASRTAQQSIMAVEHTE